MARDVGCQLQRGPMSGAYCQCRGESRPHPADPSDLAEAGKDLQAGDQKQEGQGRLRQRLPPDATGLQGQHRHKIAMMDFVRLPCFAPRSASCLTSDILFVLSVADRAVLDVTGFPSARSGRRHGSPSVVLYVEWMSVDMRTVLGKMTQSDSWARSPRRMKLFLTFLNT